MAPTTDLTQSNPRLPQKRRPIITAEQVRTVVDGLALQGRIMLRLMLLQYLDPLQEDLDYMAMDRPDPRFHAGGKPTRPYLSRDAVEAITTRLDQYRGQIRHRRERAWLQKEVLGKQIRRSETLLRIGERLLRERFGISADDLQAVKQQARTAVPKPEIRELEGRWDREEISEDEYRAKRLRIEYQAQIRRLDRERRRLDLAIRELDTVNDAALQDHEIAQIWGIPLSSLAGRKVKYLQQYLEGIQKLAQQAAPGAAAGQPPIDLWKETFLALSVTPIERTPAVYDGLQGTEAALIEKLTEYANGLIAEEKESQFWLTITQETSHLVEHGSRLKSLFALQRLSAILSDMEAPEEALEEELVARVSPKAKEETPALPEKPAVSDDANASVLQHFLGEDHTDTRARR
jgi:hypothetical protein